MSSRTSICVAAVIAVFAAFPASAVPLQITLQGQLEKDSFATSFFGITDASVPIQLSFMLDSDDALSLTAGTPVVTSTGAGFNSAAHLFNAASLSNFVATIGNTSFTAGDLVTQGLGTSGYSYSVLLLGALTDNGVAAAQLNLASMAGSLQFGAIGCSGACTLFNHSSGESYLEGTFAEIFSVQAFIQQVEEPPVSVPEPSTLGLFGIGCAAAFLVRSRRLLPKLAFA